MAYELFERLGEGWAGEVFRATMLRPRFGSPRGATVVVKLFKPAIYAADPNIRHRIDREQHLMTTLMHPNVVRALGVDVVEREGESRTALVMEYCAGGDLTRHISASHPLAPSALLDIAAGLTSGLAYLHDAGVVHRDVKPQNILLDSEGTAKLGDLGVARVVLDTTVTASDQFLGTIRYAAPEVLDGARDTPVSDVYSLGMVFYELLYGRPPIDHVKRFSALIAAIVGEGPAWPDDPDRFGPQASRQYFLLEAVARRMADRDVEKRPQAGEVLRWLGEGWLSEPLTAVLHERTSRVIEDQEEDWKEEAGTPNAWVSVDYNARRVVDQLADDEAVRILSGAGAEVIAGRPALLDRAIAYLPLDVYADLPLPRRGEVVRSFLGDYRRFIGQAPWDEGREIERLKGVYLGGLQTLLDAEPDEGLRERLIRMRDSISATLHPGRGQG